MHKRSEEPSWQQQQRVRRRDLTDLSDDAAETVMTLNSAVACEVIRHAAIGARRLVSVLLLIESAIYI